MKFEVHSRAFDGIVQPVECATREEAEQVCARLREISGRKFGATCAWEVRQKRAERPGLLNQEMYEAFGFGHPDTDALRGLAIGLGPTAQVLK